MRVELSHLLSVLSHELRGPLSVIQGYARLLLAQRGGPDPETKMLNAILSTSGRLGDIARQASDLRSWLKPPVDRTRWSVGDLIDRVSSDASDGRLTVRVADDVRGEALRVLNADQLSAAVSTLRAAASRDVANDPLELNVHTTIEDTCVTLTISPLAPTTPLSAIDDPVQFDRGGYGLALVLAGYVLDAHDASARTAGLGHVTIRLPKAGGDQ